MELTKDFEIGIKLFNPSPGFDIITKFIAQNEIRYIDTTPPFQFLHYFHEGDLSINDILGLILYYLKYGGDKLLKNKDIGLYVTDFLRDFDLLYDDSSSYELVDVFIYYTDSIYCKYPVEFPNNIDIDTVIKKIKKYYYDNYRRTLE